MAKLKFWGAVGQVTGSMFEVELDSGYRVLIDCGMSYEAGEDLSSNANFPFHPNEIDLVILTHAHTDHSGNLPTLVSQGYSKPIFCTEPTYDLVDILLTDSANIQSLKQRNRKRRMRGRRRLYGHAEVFKTLQKMITWPFDKWIEVNDQMEIRFRKAGHILGAASVEVKIRLGSEWKTIGFTGDIGEPGSKLMEDWEAMENIDFLVSESTYGSRIHRDKEPHEDVLMHHINEACSNGSGKLIIPAFSVGRTQAILFTLNQLRAEGALGKMPVFADGKLAGFSSKIHQKYSAFLNEEAQDFLSKYHELFQADGVEVIRDKEDQNALSLETGSGILVSSAGMLEGGMIREHVLNHIENPNCTFLISGYCAPDTLGGKLLRGEKQVWVKGKMRYVHAHIQSTDVFSAHTDQIGLVKYYEAVKRTSSLEKIFLVHGDSEGLTAYKSLLESKGEEVVVPFEGYEFVIV